MKNQTFNPIKAILFATVLSLSLATSFAQDKPAAFDKGSNTIALSAGFGYDYGYYNSYYTRKNYVNLPAFSLIYDHGSFGEIGPGTIGIGGIIAMKNTYYKYADGSKRSWSNYIIAARGTYHLTILKEKNNKFDPYAGIMIGVRFYHYSNNHYNDSYYYLNNRVYSVKGVFLGAKYNFAKYVGCFAEIGYDQVSIAKVGLNVNF